MNGNIMAPDKLPIIPTKKKRRESTTASEEDNPTLAKKNPNPHSLIPNPFIVMGAIINMLTIEVYSM